MMTLGSLSREMTLGYHLVRLDAVRLVGQHHRGALEPSQSVFPVVFLHSILGFEEV